MLQSYWFFSVAVHPDISAEHVLNLRVAGQLKIKLIKLYGLIWFISATSLCERITCSCPVSVSIQTDKRGASACER